MRYVFAACLVCIGSAMGTAAEVTEPGAKLERVAGEYAFTEGPAVDAAGNVFFTDQPNDRIHRWSPSGEVMTFLSPCGRSNGLFFTAEGELIACADEKNELWSIRPDGTHRVLVSGFKGKRLNGPNDVWVDPQGTMYFTDPFYKRPYWQRGPEEQDKRGLYRLRSGESEPTRIDGDYQQPNGIVGDPSRQRLYVADIGGGKINVYDWNESGEVGNRRDFCTSGSDGMTVDAEGNVYLTGKEGVLVFNAAGERVQTIAVPESWTANVTFGGSDRKTLFITASKGCYTIRMRVRGVQ